MPLDSLLPSAFLMARLLWCQRREAGCRMQPSGTPRSAPWLPGASSRLSVKCTPRRRTRGCMHWGAGRTSGGCSVPLARSWAQRNASVLHQPDAIMFGCNTTCDLSLPPFLRSTCRQGSEPTTAPCNHIIEFFARCVMMNQIGNPSHAWQLALWGAALLMYWYTPCADSSQQCGAGGCCMASADSVRSSSRLLAREPHGW